MHDVVDIALARVVVFGQLASWLQKGDELVIKKFTATKKVKKTNNIVRKPLYINIYICINIRKKTVVRTPAKFFTTKRRN